MSTKSASTSRTRAGESAFAAPDSVDDLPDPDADPATRAERSDLAARTARALATLPEDAREVVVLRDVQGLSTREAAELLGIPYETVLQTALIPLAHTIGTDFRPGPRVEAKEIAHWDAW